MYLKKVVSERKISKIRIHTFRNPERGCLRAKSDQESRDLRRPRQTKEDPAGISNIIKMIANLVIDFSPIILGVTGRA